MAQNDGVGVLVGWSSRDLGATILLELQSFERDGWDSGEEPDASRFFMTRSQAAVLADHLLRVCGAQRPPKRKRWLDSLFGP